MAFTYDPKQRSAVDGKSRLYKSSEYTDSEEMTFVYEDEHFRLEFRAIPRDIMRRYQVKGQQKEARFNSRVYIFERTLKSNFITAWRSWAGRDPDMNSYRKFRDRIAEGMTCLGVGPYSSSSIDFGFSPADEFEVKFVQKYSEVPKI